MAVEASAAAPDKVLLEVVTPAAVTASVAGPYSSPLMPVNAPKGAEPKGKNPNTSFYGKLRKC